MGIIGWIILGLLAGAIAKVLLPGRDPGGFVGTTLIGVAGAFIGGWISARWLDHPITKDFYDGATWAAAVGGSLVLLIVYRILFGNSRDWRAARQHAKGGHRRVPTLSVPLGLRGLTGSSRTAARSRSPCPSGGRSRSGGRRGSWS